MAKKYQVLKLIVHGGVEYQPGAVVELSDNVAVVHAPNIIELPEDSTVEPENTTSTPVEKPPEKPARSRREPKQEDV